MKKQIITILLLCSISPVFAEAYFEPQWNEFCPNQYINLDPDKDYILAEKKYWQERKRDFDKKIAHCKSLEDNDKQEACYENIRRIETNASNTHLAELQYKQEVINSSANMTNATTGIINSMNSSVNTWRGVKMYGY